VATRLFHDLVDDESRITSDFESFDPELDCDVETINEGLVLGYIVRGEEMESDCIPHPYPEG
jgi:hypothetical protein